MLKEDLRELLNQPYTSDNWKKVVEFVFPNASFLQRTHNIDTEHSIVESFKQIGNVKLNDGKNLALFEVKVADSVNLIGNRVTLRNLVAKYIDQQQNHGVLVIYHQGGEDYRFTFAAKSTEFDEEQSDFVNIETDTRRYTYILGKNETCRTAANRLWDLHLNKANADIKAVEKAFSVDVLNKKFFAEYKAIYEDFVQYITGKRFEKEKGKWVEKSVGTPIPEHAIAFNSDDKLARNFVKLLLGRLVFIQFLQKKGWMGVPAINEKWEEGDFDFLYNLYHNSSNKVNFHSETLYPLFFSAFNTPNRPNDVFELTNTRVPYLNGGLFENENPLTENINFPESYFDKLFDFFAQYNFTIDENDPQDHEVGIDPEMLGHIFENLLEDNKDKGAFYTPKPIVQYMCQESLIQYLKTYITKQNKWPDEDEAAEELTGHLQYFVRQKAAGNIIHLDAELATALRDVKICDPAIGSGAFPMGLLNEIYYCVKELYDVSPDVVGEIWEMEDGWRADIVKKNIIQHSIYGVDIEKGAVDIARLRFWLSLIVEEEEPYPLPNLDFKIMQGNSLLESFEGIDLSNIAGTRTRVTEVALDLFGNPVNAQTTIFDTTLIDESNISELIDLYFNAQLPGQKQELKGQIEDIIHRHIDYNLELEEAKADVKIGNVQHALSLVSIKENQSKASLEKNLRLKEKYEKELAALEGEKLALQKKREKLHQLQQQAERPYFLWHLYFKDVFDDGGFDIVIGNPPYLGEKENKHIFDKIKTSRFGKKYYYGKMDLFYFFYHIGLDFLKEASILTLISTNYFTTATGGIQLREDLKKRSTILNIINFNEFKIFESALGQHNLICILKRGHFPVKAETKIVNLKGYYGNKVIKDILFEQSNHVITHSISQEMIFKTGNITLTNSDIDLILDNMYHKSCILSKICDVNAGIHPGMDRISKKIIEKYPENNFKINEGVFILNRNESQPFKGKNYLKPLFKTKDINKYFLNDNRYYILYSSPHNKIDDEVFLKHILKFKVALLDIRITNNENIDNWPYLRRGVLNEHIYSKIPKIITGYRTTYNSFAYTEEECYGSQDVYYITNPQKNYSIKFILGLLNSKMYYKWLYYRGKRKGETLELYQEPLSKIPIIIIDNENKLKISKKVESLVNKILKSNKEQNYISEIQTNIDILVYLLYNLTYDEVKIIDPEFSLTEEEYNNFEIE